MRELDFSESLDKVRCPSLIICGGKDKANKRASTELSGILPDAELRILDGIGHEVNTEAAEELAEVLCGFYRRIL